MPHQQPQVRPPRFPIPARPALSRMSPVGPGDRRRRRRLWCRGRLRRHRGPPGRCPGAGAGVASGRRRQRPRGPAAAEVYGAAAAAPACSRPMASRTAPRPGRLPDDGRRPRRRRRAGGCLRPGAEAHFRWLQDQGRVRFKGTYLPGKWIRAHHRRHPAVVRQRAGLALRDEGRPAPAGTPPSSWAGGGGKVLMEKPVREGRRAGAEVHRQTAPSP